MPGARSITVVFVAAAGLLVGCGASATPGRRTLDAVPAGAAQAGAGPSSDGTLVGRTVSAHAQGKAEGAPDVLTLTIGVQTQAPRANAALADNNVKAAAVIAKLKADGVADKDVQTSQLSVNPVYSGDRNAVITGYQVTDTVFAKLRKLGEAGQVIDDASAAGGDATRINGIAFSIDDDSAMLLRARADAVHQAHDRAKAMADAAGAKLGQVRSIGDISVSSPNYPALHSLTAGASGQAPSVPIQAGSEQLTVEVNVVWEIE